MGPQPHIIGMPIDIIFVMLLQHSMNISCDMPAIGFISQTMPSLVMVQLIEHIIMGIIPIPFIIIGFMPFIIMGMEGIIGIMPCIGIMFMAAFIGEILDV
jgi:hypothetical protein